MPDQNRMEAFNEAVAVAKARHQQAISEAYRAFNVKHAEAQRLHREAYMAARLGMPSRARQKLTGTRKPDRHSLMPTRLRITPRRAPKWIAPFALLTRRTMRKCKQSPPSTA